jgi:hypothetical protein
MFVEILLIFLWYSLIGFMRYYCVLALEIRHESEVSLHSPHQSQEIALLELSVDGKAYRAHYQHLYQLSSYRLHDNSIGMIGRW